MTNRWKRRTGIKNKLQKLDQLEKSEKKKRLVKKRKILNENLDATNSKSSTEVKNILKNNPALSEKVSQKLKEHNISELEKEEESIQNLESLKSSSSGRSTVPYNLPHLQNLMKRDDESYLEEFKRQYSRFESLYELFILEPNQQSTNNDFIELVQFLANISSCNSYKSTLIPDFSDKIIHLLQNFGIELSADIRLALARVLITMRNKGSLAPLDLHKLCFKLFNIADKNLREILYAFIIADIKSINTKAKDNKLNKQLQNYLYTIIQDNDNKTTAKLAVDACVELYKRHIWRDAKTVNVLSSACFSKFSAIVKASLTFFCEAGADKDNDDSDADSNDEDDSDNEENELNGPTAEAYIMRQIGASSKNTKKLSKKKKKAGELLEKLRKKRKTMLKASSNDGNFAALHLLHDPQDFAERLFKQMQKAKEKFDTKLLYVDLIAKLIGVHELFLLNFYPYVERWLSPQQRNVTKILVALTTASHELVPPETLQQTIRVIADNFVSENNSSEVMAVGINSIREISKRCPLAMTEELLQDLALYKKHKLKAVSAAAKSLISAFRDLDRSMLSKKDQGRPEDQIEVGFTSSKKVNYGEGRTLEYIPGADQLDENDEGEHKNVAADRILTQADFAEIKRNQILAKILKEKQLKKAKLAMKKKENMAKTGETSAEAENLEGEASETDSITSFDIETSEFKAELDLLRKERTRPEIVSDKSVLFVEGAKRNKDKQTRMDSIEAGREDKDQYKIKQKIKKNQHTTGTNKQKSKNKAFTMVKHKMNSKATQRNYMEKANRLRESLKKAQNKAHRNKF